MNERISIRVAHVLSYVSSVYAGVPIATRRIGRLLRHYGVEVSFWTTGSEEDRKSLEGDRIPGYVFPKAFPKGWRYSPWLGKALRESSDSFDLLHLHEIWTYPIYVSARIARKRRKPYLITAHGIFTQTWRYNTPKKRLYLGLIGNRMLQAAACLQALTPAEVSGFRQAGYRGPVTIVPNGINVEEFAQLPDPEAAEEAIPELKGKRMVHYLSRLSPEKGLDQLLPAWADVTSRATYDDCILVLSGPDHNGYRSTVEHLIESCGLTGKVLLTGMVDGFKKKALISRSNVYVLPSYTEGFSNSVLENLAAGKPALITSACNFPELANAGAGICVPPEKDALAEGLRGLLDTSPEGLKEMGDRGRCLVQERYRSDIAARKLITVYNCILRGKEIPMEPEPAP